MYSAVDFNNIIDLLNGVSGGNAVSINRPWDFTTRPTFVGDSLLGKNTTDVLKNKDLTDPTNILPSVGTGGVADNSITDAKIATQTSTKISIINKALLNSAIVYNDQANTYNMPASTGAAEILATYKVSDDALSLYRITNSSGVDGHFAPSLVGNYLGNLSTPAALSITGQIDPGQDTGNAAVVQVTARNNNSTPLANRRVFRIINHATDEFSVYPTSVDFHNNYPVNMPTPNLQGSPVSGHQYGGLVPNADDPGEGLLKNLVLVRTTPDAITTAEFDGYGTWGLQLKTTGVNHQAGFYKDTATTYANKNPRLRILVPLSSPNSNDRFYCGWVGYGSAPLPETNTPLASTDVGILVGFRAVAGEGWKVFSSAGTGTAMRVQDIGVDRLNSAGLLRDFELKSVSGSSKWTINPIHTGYAGDTATANVPQDVTINVPAPSTKLYFHCYYQKSTFATTSTISILGAEVESGTIYGGNPI